MEQLKTIINFLPKDYRFKLYLFYLTTLLGNILDVISIGLFLPTIKFLIEKKSGFEFLDNFFIKLGLDQNGIILTLLVTIILIFIFKNIVVLLINIFQTKFTSSLSIKLSLRLYDQYLSIPLSLFSKINSATFLRNTNAEVFLFVRYVITSILLVLSDITLIVFFVILLSFTVSSKAILVLIFFSIVAYLIYLPNKGKIRNLGINRTKISENILQFLKEGLESLREIKLYSIKDYFINRYKNESEKIIPLTVVIGIISTLPRIIIEVIAVVVFSIIIFFTIKLDKSFTDFIPELTIFLLCIYRITPGVSRILQNFQTMKHYMPSFYIIKNIIKDHESKINEVKKENHEKINFQKISLTNVSFKYEDEVILENINFELKKKSKILISGKSGSGKSTLLDLITGFQKPAMGKIFLNDKEVLKNEFEQIFSNISYVSQSPFFLDSDVISNIAIGQKEKVKESNLTKIVEILKLVQLEEFAENILNKKNVNLGERAKLISGGQKQRLAIARALFFEPEILILDEATNSLDKITEKKVFDNIIKNYQDLTLIVVSHSDERISDKFDEYKIIDKNLVFNEK